MPSSSVGVSAWKAVLPQALDWSRFPGQLAVSQAAVTSARGSHSIPVLPTSVVSGATGPFLNGKISCGQIQRSEPRVSWEKCSFQKRGVNMPLRVRRLGGTGHPPRSSARGASSVPREATRRLLTKPSTQAKFSQFR